MAKEKDEAKLWIRGAIYLSLAAFIAKFLSALYKVPYQNMTGDVGYYVYQQVYPIYGVALVLGTYGFPLVISQMTGQGHSGKLHSNDNYLQRLILLFWAMLILNGTIGILLILLATPIAQTMGDLELATAIRWLGLPFFLIAFLSIGRGYYQGRGNMIPTALSQVIEQMARVVVILLIAAWAMRLGDPYLAGISAGLGAFMGGLVGIVTLVIYGKRKELFLEKSKKNLLFPFYKDWKKDVRTLFITGFLVSVSAMALILFQLYDAFSVVQHLMTSGMETEAATIRKGVYDRGWPLIQLGAVVSTAFSYGAIPYIRKSVTSHNWSSVKFHMAQSIKICLVFGGAASVGLISVMEHLNPMLFTSGDGKFTIQLLSATVLFGALFMTTAALLHAVEKSHYAAGLLVLGVIIKGIGNAIAVPAFGIEGAAIATSTSFFIISTLGLFLLRKLDMYHPYPKLFWLKWGFSLLTMGVSVLSMQWLIREWLFGEMVLTRAIHSFLAVGVTIFGGAVFLIIIWLLRIFTVEEWESLPKIPRLLPYKVGSNR